jgi:hypothetical protein
VTVAKYSRVTSYLDEVQPHAGKVRGPDTIRCKFVIIDNQGTLALVFGPVDRLPYHANLVDRFCADHGIASSWVKRPDHVEINEPGVRILGGGDLRINSRERSMVLAGASRAYGFFPADSVRQIVAEDPFFQGFAVTVK